jgi:LDH2 family malate/lactate/ureidoglycolate dehydrogenase
MSAWTQSLLEAVGLTAAAATCVVDTLEYAERRGFASHGFMRLPTYAGRIQAGGINRAPNISLLSDHAGLAIVDADAAAGAYSAVQCTDLAIEKARTAGVGMVLARNANHFGATGYYTDRMANAGFAGIALCNTDAVMCAPFGGKAVLGTNPISVAAPVVEGVGPQLDMATTEASYGKILLARDHDESIPLGWGVDERGAPTTDPRAVLAGALLPSGGPKGFGLAVMVDCIVAIAGAETSNAVSALYGDASAPQRLGHAFIAVAVDHVQSRDDYATRIADFTKAVHSSATEGSLRPPLVPGEPEAQRLRDMEAWAVDVTTLRQYVNLAQALNVAIPDAVSSVSVAGV